MSILLKSSKLSSFLPKHNVMGVNGCEPLKCGTSQISRKNVRAISAHREAYRATCVSDRQETKKITIDEMNIVESFMEALVTARVSCLFTLIFIMLIPTVSAQNTYMDAVFQPASLASSMKYLFEYTCYVVVSVAFIVYGYRILKRTFFATKNVPIFTVEPEMVIRPTAKSKEFVDYREQNRSMKAAVLTRLQNVAFTQIENKKTICMDLVMNCVCHFTMSAHTRDSIIKYMYDQSQYNMTVEEWTVHKLYLPSMVSYLLRHQRAEAAVYWDAESWSEDIEEMSIREQKRKLWMWYYFVFGTDKTITWCQMIISWLLVVATSVCFIGLFSSISHTIVTTFVTPSLESNSQHAVIKDQCFYELPGLTMPALKPMKKGFKWSRKPVNENQRTSTLVSLFAPENMPTQIGLHYNLKDAGNMIAAIEQRVAVTNVVEGKYKPDFRTMHKLSDKLRKLIASGINQEVIYPTRENVVAWLERRDYSQSRKDSILRAYDNAESLLPEDLLRQKSGRVEAFIKEEYYTAVKNPRAILARGDLAKAILGPIFDNLNHQFFTLPETVKKITANDRPEYIQTHCGGPNYYVTDHTAFECSATAEIQYNMEHRIYKRILGEDAYRYVEILLETQKVSVGNGTCSVPASRFSGEMNTSLGNSIVNYIVIQMIMKKFHVEGNFFIEGDDGLLCFKDELDVEAVRAYALSQGFNLKIDKVATPGAAGFLSTFWDSDNVPYKYPLGTYMCGNAWRTLGKRIPDHDLVIARLASMIEENPKNGLLIALLESFCKLYGHKDKVYVYKEDDAYFREKLMLQGVKYKRVEGKLRYRLKKYEAIGSEAFLLDHYNMNSTYQQELYALIRLNPEKAYAKIADAFTTNEGSDWQDRML